MNAVKIAAVGLLLGASYVLWSRSAVAVAVASGDEPDSFEVGFTLPFESFQDFGEVILETVSPFVGVSMPSSSYQTALNNPANSRIIGLLSSAEDKYGIPAGLLVRQAWQESRFNPQAVNRWSGAKGLMQFMTSTAKEWGVDVFDAASSADGAGRYMQWLKGQTGSWSLALAAYNWGIGNVLRKGFSSAPKETRDYVAQIGVDAGIG